MRTVFADPTPRWVPFATAAFPQGPRDGEDVPFERRAEILPDVVRIGQREQVPRHPHAADVKHGEDRRAHHRETREPHLRQRARLASGDDHCDASPPARLRIDRPPRPRVHQGKSRAEEESLLRPRRSGRRARTAGSAVGGIRCCDGPRRASINGMTNGPRFVLDVPTTAIMLHALGQGSRYLEGPVIRPAIFDPRHAFAQSLEYVYTSARNKPPASGRNVPEHAGK